MTRTLGQLKLSLRNRLNEDTARAWSDDKLREWIMEGARDVARRAECLWATSSFAVVAGTPSYSLAAITPGIVRIHRVEFVPTGQQLNYCLEYRDRFSMDAVWGTSQSISQSTPEFFTLWGAPPNLTIQMFPVPSLAGTATLYYYALPANLVTIGATGEGSNVDCPDGWEDVILDYAEYHALRMDRDDRWKDILAAYEQRLVDLAATSIRWSDQSGWITSGSGFLPAWLSEGY